MGRLARQRRLTTRAAAMAPGDPHGYPKPSLRRAPGQACTRRPRRDAAGTLLSVGIGKQRPQGRAGAAGHLRGWISSAREYVALRLAPPVSADDAGIPWVVHPGGRYYVGQDGHPAVPEDVVAENVPGAIPGRDYHQALPPDLAPWHVYTAAGGHQLMIHPAGIRAPAWDPAAFLVLVPVRTVLRSGWRTDDGVIVSAVPFSNGPVYSPADIER
jgi:hypothetical protein